MVNIIKRGGFREQAARQLKYKNSVNQRTDINAHATYQPVDDNAEAQTNQATLEPCNTLDEAITATIPATTALTITESEDTTPKNN